MTGAFHPCHISLPCRIRHIFDEYTVTHSGVVDEDVGYSAHKLAVSDNGRAEQE